MSYGSIIDGAIELVTPPIDSGVVLPGVTRKSVLELTRAMNKFEVCQQLLYLVH